MQHPSPCSYGVNGWRPCLGYGATIYHTEYSALILNTSPFIYEVYNVQSTEYRVQLTDDYSLQLTAYALYL